MLYVVGMICGNNSFNACMDMHMNTTHTHVHTPTHTHTTQAIGYGLVLLDGNVVNVNKLKRLNLSRVDRLFRVSHHTQGI